MAAYYDKKTRSWYAKFRYRDWQGMSRSTTRRGFEKKKDAIEYERDFKSTSSKKPELTVKQLADLYIADKKPRVRESTFSSIKHRMRHHVLPSLGHVKISQLTPSVIRQWQNHLPAFSPSYINTLNVTFSAMLNYAVKYYGLAVNPFSIAGRTGENEARTQFLELEEFKRLLAVVDSPYRALEYKMVFYGGFRIGELQALEIEDFDFEKNTININKSYTKNTRKVGPAKTKNSNRILTMPPSLMAEVQDYISRMPVKMPPFRVYTQTAESKALHKYLQAAGLPSMSMHALRHSHASLLIHAGVPVVDVARRMGHTPTMTLRIYAHIYADSGKKIAEMLENL